VFYDRFQMCPVRMADIVAYVIVDEVTHILEGVARHSKTGIMKAHWDAHDRFEIGLGRLGFAPEDIDLIHSGFASRNVQLIAAY
jgi:hypothetical protein